MNALAVTQTSTPLHRLLCHFPFSITSSPPWKHTNPTVSVVISVGFKWKNVRWPYNDMMASLMFNQHFNTTAANIFFSPRQVFFSKAWLGKKLILTLIFSFLFHFVVFSCIQTSSVFSERGCCSKSNRKGTTIYPQYISNISRAPENRFEKFPSLIICKLQVVLAFS